MRDYELPEELFRVGSPAESAENYLRHLEGALLGELVATFRAARVEEARQHLQGCAKRLLMMRHARGAIADASEGERPPLDSYELNALNVFLNGYYVNLLGALDNLAWASVFEFALLPVIDERDLRTRRFAALSSKALIKALSERRPELGALVVDHGQWISAVKDFRDPAAHRLPLTLMRGIMTEEEGLRYQELESKKWEAFADGRIEDSEMHDAEAQAIGRFVPFLEAPRAPDGGVYIVPAQMAQDQRRFLDFTHAFLKAFPRAAA